MIFIDSLRTDKLVTSNCIRKSFDTKCKNFNTTLPIMKKIFILC